MILESNGIMLHLLYTGEPYPFCFPPSSFSRDRELMMKAPPIYYFIELCKVFRTTQSCLMPSDMNCFPFSSRFCCRVTLRDIFKKKLIKWLSTRDSSWEYFYLIPRSCNLQSNMQWKLVWKSTSISEAWECVALKWHANQFEKMAYK